MMRKEVCIILHNLRSAHNVGSIFRTAEAAGVKRIYLTGYTPVPLDKFGRVNKEIKKTALGAEKVLSWQKETNIATIIKKLKFEKFKIVVVEQDKKSINYKKLKLNTKTVFIFGNEVKGLPKTALKQSNKIIEIPMRGKKESLNVAVAAGVVLFSILG